MSEPIHPVDNDPEMAPTRYPTRRPIPLHGATPQVVIPSAAVALMADSDPYVAAAKTWAASRPWMPTNPQKLAQDPGWRAAITQAIFPLTVQIDEQQRLLVDAYDRLSRIRAHALRAAYDGHLVSEIIGRLPGDPA